MSGNSQNLPAGLAARAASAAAPSAPAPAPAPAYVPPADRGPVELPEGGSHQVQQPSAPAATPPVNPMLSHVSQQPVADPNKPAEPLPELGQQPPAPDALKPVPLPEAEKPDTPAASTTVAELAGAFATDTNLAPAVGYIDSYCQDKGLDVQRAFAKAAEEGDARFIDEGYLKEKLGDAEAAKLIKVASDVLNYVEAYQEQSVQAAIKIAGGQAGWDQAVNVFNEKADPMDRQIVADLLNSGVRTKVEHAAKLLVKFATEQGGMISHHQPALGQPGSQKGLSATEYLEKIQNPRITHEQYEEAKALRKLGRAQGLK